MDHDQDVQGECSLDLYSKITVESLSKGHGHLVCSLCVKSEYTAFYLLARSFPVFLISKPVGLSLLSVQSTPVIVQGRVVQAVRTRILLRY